MLPGAGYWVQQPRCLCPLSVISDKSEGMSSLKPHRSSTRRMRRRTGCGRGCAQRSRAQPGTRYSGFHDLLACLAFLDGTASTRRFGSTLLGCSHSPTSAFLHCHHSFSGASNRTVGKSQSTAICRRAFFLDAFGYWPPVSPGNREITKSIQATCALVCWPTHTGAPDRSP